jgi:hypothetical protein
MRGDACAVSMPSPANSPSSPNPAAAGVARPARPTVRNRPAPVRRGRHLPAPLYGALIVVLFGGVIGISAVVGLWQTSGRSATGGGSVTLEGSSTTEIKGWMAVGDVADAFGVSLADLFAAFALDPETSRSTPVKDLESDLFSVVALRAWIDLQIGQAP